MTTSNTEYRTALPVTTTQNADIALLLLRLATGGVFLTHGLQKLLTFTLPGTISNFTKMGIPVPTLSGPLVTAVEVLGGLLMILGLFSRWAAVFLALDILGAILMVHLKAGFFGPAGFEYPMMLLVAAIAVALIGPGRFGINRR